MKKLINKIKKFLKNKFYVSKDELFYYPRFPTISATTEINNSEEFKLRLEEIINNTKINYENDIIKSLSLTSYDEAMNRKKLLVKKFLDKIDESHK
jgi:hypothetical protein